MTLQRFGKWQISYPAEGNDWNTALALSADKEYAFGVETRRTAGASGVYWSVPRIINPHGSPQDLQRVVRGIVRQSIDGRSE